MDKINIEKRVSLICLLIYFLSRGEQLFEIKEEIFNIINNKDGIEDNIKDKIEGILKKNNIKIDKEAKAYISNL